MSYLCPAPNPVPGKGKEGVASPGSGGRYQLITNQEIPGVCGVGRGWGRGLRVLRRPTGQHRGRADGGTGNVKYSPFQ